MILVINSQGGLVSIQDEDLFQGSTNLNVINLLAPFSDSVVWKAVFEMPDGTYKPDNLDGYLFQSSMKIADNLNAWKLPITFPISQEYGVVTMQLRGISGDTVVCTTSVKFTIQKGVPYASNFEELSDKDQLLQMIADVKALVNNKVDIANYVYELAEDVSENTVGDYYVYENGEYVPKTLPQEYDSTATYYENTYVGIVTNVDRNLSLTYSDKKSNETMTLKIEKDKATLNGKQVVVFDDLTADNIIYDNSATNIDADNVNDAIDTLQSSIDEVESMISSGQVVEVGDITIKTGDWALVDNIYQYQFTNAELKDASVQFLVITPNKDAIDNLNDNNILVYPEIEMYQQSEGVAVAVIRVDKKPTFDITADVKIYSSILTANTRGIKASQISFSSTDDIPQTNVQSAILQVQTNLSDFETQYNTDKDTFATLDDDGKIPASQLPSYVDDVVEGYLYNGQFYAEESHTTVMIPQSGKIYVDLPTSKEYRWSGTQYSIISESLALGETAETAYAGNKGKQNADDIADIMNGTTAVPKATNSILNNDGSYSGFTKDANSVLKIVNNIIPQKELLYTNSSGADTNTEINLTLNAGDIIEIEYSIGKYGSNHNEGLHRFIKFKISEATTTSHSITIPDVTISGNNAENYSYRYGNLSISITDLSNTNVLQIGNYIYISGATVIPDTVNFSSIPCYIYNVWKIIE